MSVIKFTAELHLALVNTQWMLAVGHKDVGDYAAAIEAYNRLLEHNKDNGYIKSQLKWLRRQ